MGNFPTQVIIRDIFEHWVTNIQNFWSWYFCILLSLSLWVSQTSSLSGIVSFRLTVIFYFFFSWLYFFRNSLANGLVFESRCIVTQNCVKPNNCCICVSLPLKYIKVVLSPSKKILFICFNESLLKMIKNVFYFILKALFILMIFKFLSWHFGHVEETA